MSFEMDAAGYLLVDFGGAAVNLDNRVGVWVDVYHRKAFLTLSNKYA